MSVALVLVGIVTAFVLGRGWPPFWRYWREFIAGILGFACALTGHAGGCWLLNHSPARRVWRWAFSHKFPPATTAGSGGVL